MDDLKNKGNKLGERVEKSERIKLDPEYDALLMRGKRGRKVEDVVGEATLLGEKNVRADKALDTVGEKLGALKSENHRVKPAIPSKPDSYKVGMSSAKIASKTVASPLPSLSAGSKILSGVVEPTASAPKVPPVIAKKLEVSKYRGSKHKQDLGGTKSSVASVGGVPAILAKGALKKAIDPARSDTTRSDVTSSEPIGSPQTPKVSDLKKMFEPKKHVNPIPTPPKPKNIGETHRESMEKEDSAPQKESNKKENTIMLSKEAIEMNKRLNTEKTRF